MKCARTWILWSLLAVLPIVGCSDRDSDKNNTVPTLLFEIEAGKLENHPFPSDIYQDRIFVSQAGVPLLASAQIRAAAGIPESMRVRGFTLAQTVDTPFITQLGLAGRVAFSTTSTIRIPLSGSNSFGIDLNTVTSGAIRIFELGRPDYAATPPFSATLKKSDNTDLLTSDSMTIREIPIGEAIFNGVTNSLIIRPALPVAAAIDLLLVTKGWIRFRNKDSLCIETTISKPTQSLLLEAARLQDERALQAHNQSPHSPG